MWQTGGGQLPSVRVTPDLCGEVCQDSLWKEPAGIHTISRRVLLGDHHTPKT